MSFIKSKGEKNFDRCPHKDIVFKPRYYTDSAKRATDFKSEISGTTYGPASVSAHATCPVTADGEPIRTDGYWSSRGTPKTQEAARKNLGHVAGLSICNTCPLVDLSPTQVVERRISIAETEARALIAEANLKHLQQRVANGEDIVADLPPVGVEFTPTPITPDPNL